MGAKSAKDSIFSVVQEGQRQEYVLYDNESRKSDLYDWYDWGVWEWNGRGETLKNIPGGWRYFVGL